ncbi:MAG TPA: ATP-binding protein [Solirubrobacteraceae bacterium]|jgi:ATP-dependent DNA helicase RecG|nr:ATP-binding protein [Solirubrobacteraceae bacterium]
MTGEELHDIIIELQSERADTAAVEAKRAAAGLPRSLRDTLSSFSNTPGGGVIVLGVDEEAGFAVSGITDPGKLQADFSSMCNSMVPPVRALVDIHQVDGAHVLVAEVPELPPSEKPCYYSGAGLVNGSYIRVGDADQRLTQYEVLMMRANAGRPREDLLPVVEGSIGEFDTVLVDALVNHVRQREPRAFTGKSRKQTLLLLRATFEHEGKEVPTLAGWLTLAEYPQRLFPNLTVTFVHYPTSRAGELGPDGQRFIDERGFSGPLPRLIPDVMHALRVNMPKGAFAGRSFSQWPYPEDAIRECLVNAVVHRDYSSLSSGTAVQVELYPDRLLIKSPGGLYGTVHEDQLGDEGISSTRNEALVRLLEVIPASDNDNPLCQNRGTGIPLMLAALRKAKMRPPRFRDRISGFDVTIPGASLFGEETLKWLSQFSAADLNEHQRTALALAHSGETVTNATLRRATGLDSRAAGGILVQLADRGFLVQQGVTRWTTYRVAPGWKRPEEAGSADESTDARPLRKFAALTPALRDVMELFDEHDELSRTDIERLLNLKKQATIQRLRRLHQLGLLQRTKAPRSRNVAYKKAASAENDRSSE